MKKSLHSIKKILLLTAGIFILTSNFTFAQTSVVVNPGLNTIQAAMAAHPGDTLVLKKGKEYVVSSAIEITQPTVIKGEAYDRTGAGDPPAVIRGSANPGEEDSFYMILAAADLTLIDLGFIGFTWDNKQIDGVVKATKSHIDFDAHGCVLQGCRRWIVTAKFAGLNYVLHDNIHFNISTTGNDNYAGWGGPAYKGDSTTNHTYNCTYFVGGRMFLSGSTGPTGWQWADHCTYVNTWGETYHKSKMDGFKAQNCIFFNTHLRGYVGKRQWINGTDTVSYGGDYVSYRQLGDTLNGDCAVFPHKLDTVDDGSDNRFVVITNNLKFNEQRVLDWHNSHAVTTQPFLAWAMRYRANEFGWTIAPNWTPDSIDQNSYDPQFKMGAIPDGAFEAAWEQRFNRMDPSKNDREIAWRPNGAEPKDFIWPLPFDFTPQNQALMSAGSDGFPLGDLNWLPANVKAAWEAGEDNPLTSINSVRTEQLDLVNYPNPFSSATTISYSLKGKNDVTMKLYDITGIEVATLVNETQIPGKHNVSFDGSKLPEGVYLLRIKAGNTSETHKMTLIK